MIKYPKDKVNWYYVCWNINSRWMKITSAMNVVILIYFFKFY